MPSPGWRSSVPGSAVSWARLFPLRTRQHIVTYAGHYANATGNLKPRAAEEENTNGSKPESPSRNTGKKWTWAKLIARAWQVDPLICECGAKMKRGRPLRDEELREFLRSLNKLGYPPRPPPTLLPDPQGVDEPVDDDFVEPPEHTFSNDFNQVSPGWDDL